jgi:hypothetical protein
MTSKEKAKEFIESFNGSDGIKGSPFSEQLELNLIAGIAQVLKEQEVELTDGKNNMQDGWIPIAKMSIPTNAECDVWLYTPHSVPTMRFRVMSASTAGTCRKATHWQPCIAPKEEA